MTIRIRYSEGWDTNDKHERVSKKNTLVTEQKGDYLYFGIARCNFILKDRFIKKEGRRLATEQLEKAKRTCRVASTAFVLDQSGLFGYCHKSMKSVLTNYFHRVDGAMWSANIQSTRK